MIAPGVCFALDARRTIVPPDPARPPVELFDPQTGHRIRIDAPATHGLRQRAPRSVQFALTNPCNLGCSFRSRPVERLSTWTVASALEVLADLDRLGVTEAAFGGGEYLGRRSTSTPYGRVDDLNDRGQD